MQNEKEVKKISNQIKRCRKCFLWKDRINAVSGEGPDNAKIMFIGEAPGKNEDETGRPFCGRSGRLLGKLLEENNIERVKVFITSVVKCRPPKNRKPEPDELKKCRIWWQKQIEIINPQKIVVLGKTAFDEVIGGGELKKHRGKWQKIKNRYYFTTYHPAAGLRSPKKIKKILNKDFRKISKGF